MFAITQAISNYAVISVICLISESNTGLWLVTKGQQWLKNPPWFTQLAKLLQTQQKNMCWNQESTRVLYSHLQWVSELQERQEFFHVNKSCKIECCGNKMHQIIQNMVLPQSLELKLSLCERQLSQVSIPYFRDGKSIWHSAPIIFQWEERVIYFFHL